MARKTKAELEAALETSQKEVAALRSEAAASAAAGVSRAPLGAPAGPPRPLYVRVSRTFKWNGHRVGTGVVVINPDLGLLKAGHGNWEWVPINTWDACKRKSCCSEGQLQPWAPPGR